MCFSPEASFAAGAALLPAGVYCAQAAIRKNMRLIPLALVPVAFGVQQVSEGFVWRGLQEENVPLIQQASVVFLFFAIAFWPCWIPLSLAVAETRRPRQITLTLLTVLCLAWLGLYFPLAADPSKWFTTEVMHHSIRYEVGDLPGFALAPRLVWRLGYVAIICGALAIGRFHPKNNPWGNLGAGVLVAGLFAVSYGIYWYAFLSVWCFFAASVSLLLCTTFYQLPAATPTQPDSPLYNTNPPIAD
jgi:hypothetical protein